MQAVLGLQVSVVAFVSPVSPFSVQAARPLVAIHRRVHGSPRKPRFVETFFGIRVVLGRRRLLRREFLWSDLGADGVFLDAVFDLVQVLARVVGRVVVLGGRRGRRRGGVPGCRGARVLLATPSHAPQCRPHQRQRPDHCCHGNQHWHQVIVGAAGGPALDAYLRDGSEDGTVSAAFAHHVDDPVRDPFNRSVAAAAVLSDLNGDVYFAAGRGGRFTGDGDGELGGEVLHHVETAQLSAHLLHCHALRHDVLRERERDVGAVAVGVAPGLVVI